MLGKISASLNNKLKNVKWGQYRLDDLFEIVGTKSLDSNAIEFVDNGINFIGRTSENNGIQGKIEERNFKPNEPYTITATVIGNYKYVKYQKEPYYCSQNINKLTPKPIFKKWNEKIAYFMITNIQKFVSLYNNQQGGYKLVDIKNHIVKLPLLNNNIDFDFMESFISELEKQHISELSDYLKESGLAYLKASGLNDYVLTPKEHKAIEDYENVKFQDYNITQIFDIKNTKNILSRDVVLDSGHTPYLCASAENNSVCSYIEYDKNLIDKGNCIFIGGKTFVVSYQDKDFYSNDSHNLVLYLKNYSVNKFNQLYLATCIEKSLSHKYSWGSSVSNAKIKSDVISLPTSNNKIDIETMDTFISAIQKLVIKDVIDYTNRKINATKEVVNKNNK